jgi:8-oxo-dGTP diphosphatase
MAKLQLTSAVHLLIERDGKILLLRRFNTGYQDGNYSVVAGHIDTGESATTAMCREAAEESGICVSPTDLRFACVLFRKKSDGTVKSDLFFTCDTWSGELRNMEPHKCDDLSWHDRDHLPANMVPYVRRVLDLTASGASFGEFGW